MCVCFNNMRKGLSIMHQRLHFYLLSTAANHYHKICMLCVYVDGAFVPRIMCGTVYEIGMKNCFKLNFVKLHIGYM